MPSEDILSYAFETEDKIACAIVYADGMVNKQLLGDLVARPLSRLSLSEEKQGGRVVLNQEKALKIIQKTALFPEIKTVASAEDIQREVLDGNSLLLIDGLSVGVIVGAKFLPVRAIMEPPTDIAVKGPREGFIEDTGKERSRHSGSECGCCQERRIHSDGQRDLRKERRRDDRSPYRIQVYRRKDKGMGDKRRAHLPVRI